MNAIIVRLAEQLPRSPRIFHEGAWVNEFPIHVHASFHSRFIGRLAAAAAVLAQNMPVPIASSPITLSFGMIGLGGGQTVRLNAVNIVRTPPPIAIAQIPCRVELDLFDAQGSMLKQNVIVNLGYGRSAFVEA